jgi:hypothetical protein
VGIPDQLLGCLAEVPDLDKLHPFLLNEHTDQFGSPPFSAWLLDLLNTERQRRSGSVAHVDFSIPEFDTWPPSYLVQATTLTLLIVEAAVMVGEPSILAFAFKLCELLIGSLSLAYLSGMAANHGQN